ncbi:L,D-transpeptidase family protein [Sphingomonas sp. 179-A 2A2 NHS]|jgi:hypothetical protein
MMYALLLAALPIQAEPAQPPITVTGKATLDNASVLRAARALKPGEYLWAPQTAPEGPMLMVVSLETQRAVVYRNGVPIGITTISSGKRGHETPVGIFTVLQKKKEHYSNLYNSAPMPFMQRLTWDGIALHAGKLPGHAASHGCIRLPDAFAKLLYDQTRLGMTVVVTKQAALPSIAAAADLIGAAKSGLPAPRLASAFWEPERSPTGSVSFVVSTADRALTVIRGGRIIGRVPVSVARPVTHAYLYSYRGGTGDPATQWSRIALPGQSVDEDLAAGDVTLPDAYRGRVEAVLAPGATVVVTPDSLSTTATNLQDFVTGN